MENTRSKKRFNTVDVIIVVLLALCLAGVALRFILIRNTPDDVTSPDIEYKKYYVTYMIREERWSMVDYLEKDGVMFRFYDSNNDFGVTTGSVNATNALKRYYNEKGEYVSVYNMAEEESVARCDISGSFLVEGKYTEDGVFIIKDSEYSPISLNKAVQLRSDEMIVGFTVTDIKPVE